MKNSNAFKLASAAMLAVAPTMFVGCGNDCDPGNTINDGDGNCVAVTQDNVAINCGAGTRLVGRRCVAEGEIVTCGSGTMVMEGTCVPALTCGENTEESDGACVPSGTVCGEGSSFDTDTGKCIGAIAGACGEGTTENDMQVCVVDADTVCGENLALADDGRCVVPAEVQLIHNGAGVPAVDVYVVPEGEDIADGAAPFAELAFREATGLVVLPANEPYDVYVAVDGEADPQANAAIVTRLNLPPRATENSVVRLIAVGSATANPDTSVNADVAPQLLVVPGTKAPMNPAAVAFQVVHGVTDAPAVDVFAEIANTGTPDSGANIVDDASYTDFTAPFPVDPADLVVSVTDGSDNSAVVSRSTLLAEEAAGASFVALASGFLTPEDDGDGPAFGILLVRTDGTTSVLGGTARLQVIHNASDPAAAAVDVLVNGVPALEDFAFRAATPFLWVTTRLDVAIAAPDTTMDLLPEGSAVENLELPAGQFHVAVAQGVVPANAANFITVPDELNIDLRVTALTNVGNDAEDDASVALNVVHGVADAGNVDIEVGGTVVAADVAFGTGAARVGEVSAASTFMVRLLAAGTETSAAEFTVDPTGLDDQVATVLASGFVDTTGQPAGAEGLALLVVTNDGTVVELFDPPPVVAVPAAE